MRKNRKLKRHSVFRAGSVGTAILIVTGFIMLMVYWSIDSRCTSIARDIGKAEKRYAALEAECVQETARWDSMKTPEKLSEKLLRFGLEMKYARQDQIVRVTSDGKLAPGQISVTRARQRSRTDAMAMQVPDAVSRERIRPAVVSLPSRRAATRR